VCVRRTNTDMHAPVDFESMTAFVNVNRYNRQTRNYDYHFISAESIHANPALLNEIPHTTRAKFIYHEDLNEAEANVGDLVRASNDEFDPMPNVATGHWLFFSEQIKGQRIILFTVRQPNTWEKLRQIMHRAAQIMLGHLQHEEQYPVEYADDVDEQRDEDMRSSSSSTSSSSATTTEYSGNETDDF